MKKNSTVQINKILRKEMEARNLGVKELSKSTGIPQSTISSYLSGVKASYDPTHLQTLSATFSLSIDYLLFGTEPHSFSALNSLLTEKVFSGYLRVNIERVLQQTGKELKK